jgi:hypothetical protein
MDSTPVFDLIRRIPYGPITTDETRSNRDLHCVRQVQHLQREDFPGPPLHTETAEGPGSPVCYAPSLESEVIVIGATHKVIGGK